MHNSTEAKAIRQRMEEVRHDLDEDVQEIVEGARDLGEWRSYVRSYPWISLGVALAAGYLIVPRRTTGTQPDSQSLAELAKQNRLLGSANSAPKGNVSGRALAIVGDIVMREVASYVGQQAGKLFATHAAKSQQDEQP